MHGLYQSEYQVNPCKLYVDDLGRSLLQLSKVYMTRSLAELVLKWYGCQVWDICAGSTLDGRLKAVGLKIKTDLSMLYGIHTGMSRVT